MSQNNNLAHFRVVKLLLLQLLPPLVSNWQQKQHWSSATEAELL